MTLTDLELDAIVEGITAAVMTRVKTLAGPDYTMIARATGTVYREALTPVLARLAVLEQRAGITPKQAAASVHADEISTAVAAALRSLKE